MRTRLIRRATKYRPYRHTGPPQAAFESRSLKNGNVLVSILEEALDTDKAKVLIAYLESEPWT